MAIAPTGNIFKCLEFDGVSSKEFGVYITGQAVYNAPERAVEMISIPNRNGAFALDKGYFENIEVTYPAGIYADTEIDFAEAISDFRNFLCSRKGYCRLVDEYNNDEYRMAIYKSGLEVTPTNLKAGEFNITFDCKPQRYLMSGEAAIEISDDDMLMNPTLFESSPLLIVDGYGNIDIGDQRVVVEDIFIGDVPIGNAQTFNNTDVSLEFDDKASMFNEGDQITIRNIILRSTMTITNTAYYVQEAGQDDRPMGIIYWNSPNTDATLGYSCSGKVVSFSMTIPQITLTVGVNLKKTYSTRATVKVEIDTGTAGTDWERNSEYATTTIDYKNGKIKITAQRLFLDGGYLNYAWPITQNTITIGAINGYSTISIKDGTKYIDCDIGEAYKYEDGQYISLNSSVNLGADLPVLYPGVSNITYDNTITGLQIVPRWWKI